MFPTYTLAEEGAIKAVNAVKVSLAASWLQRSVLLVLSRLVFLSVFHALRNQKLTRSCLPSREYLATAFGLSVSTISFITTLLVRIGLITKIQRRPDKGQWHSCLYKLAGPVWEIVKKITIRFIKILNRVGFSQHIVSKDIDKSTFREENKVSNDCLKAPPLPDWLIRQSERMNLSASGA